MIELNYKKGHFFWVLIILNLLNKAKEFGLTCDFPNAMVISCFLWFSAVNILGELSIHQMFSDYFQNHPNIPIVAPLRHSLFAMVLLDVRL